MQDLAQTTALEIQFTINGTEYEMGYNLSDGTYPEWAAFVKNFAHPRDPKRLLFKERQENARKDAERAFGVLKSFFIIVLGPTRSWHKRRLHDIMDTCIILHNMIVEDKRHTYSRNISQDDFSSTIVNDFEQEHDLDFEIYLARDAII
ncbi:uncharacterized protein LOC141602023 [Silene latifolia]|uniref:uncharacterized protein LOC141602023 n=1 Tax=Silene latifolia TaxID=37657 RepID=UPI003D76C629